MKKKNLELIWYNKKNEIISCIETNKVLNENFAEVQSLVQNCIDDAIILGCKENDIKKKLIKVVDDTNFSLGKKKIDKT